MPEFTAVSSADPSALVNELNAHAASGWEVVSVVESGETCAIMREGAPARRSARRSGGGAAAVAAPASRSPG
jgi:hypothetical protein